MLSLFLLADLREVIIGLYFKMNWKNEKITMTITSHYIRKILIRKKNYKISPSIASFNLSDAEL